MATIPLRPPGANPHDLLPASIGARPWKDERATIPEGRRRARPRVVRVVDGPSKESEDGPRRGARERALEDGIASLGDSDLVTLVLGAGMVGKSASVVASGVLDRFGGLEGITHLGPAALAGQPGLGPAKAMRLAASLELGRRVSERSACPRHVLSSPAAVARWFASRIGSLVHEEMWVVSLDGRQGMRGTRRVAQGGLHGCGVTARDILRLALADAASSMILIHNHPSGDPTPSVEDIATTRAVASAAAIVGMPLLDHVIVTGVGDYASFMELGLLETI